MLTVEDGKGDPTKEIDAGGEPGMSGVLEATRRKCVKQEGVITVLRASDIPNMIKAEN